MTPTEQLHYAEHVAEHFRHTPEPDQLTTAVAAANRAMGKCKDPAILRQLIRREVLFTAYHRLVREFVKRFLLTPKGRLLRLYGTRNDIVQEGFVTLLRAADYYSPEKSTAKFSTYLVRCLFTNFGECVVNKRLVRTPVHAGRGAVIHQMMHQAGRAIPSREEEVPEQAARSELQADVREALDTLSPRVRFVVTEHFLNSRTLREVGEALGFSHQRAWTLLHRGLNQLREKLCASHL